jgi:Zinc finger C-x8-C-x5-C-x3-H type (and similar)
LYSNVIAKGPVKLCQLTIENIYQGEKECNYYLKTGNCKYNSACKFHHPEKAVTNQAPSSASVPINYSAAQSSSVITQVIYPPLPNLNMNLNVGRYPVPPRNYGAMVMPPGVVPAPGWNSYLVTFLLKFSFFSFIFV